MRKYIKKYQHLIETLAPRAHDFDFHERVAHELSEPDEDTRFLVTMEMKRLAQPCIHPIDLRLLVDDDCDIKLHEGIKHFLCTEGDAIFEDLLSRYGNYTIGVKEGVEAYFKQQQDIQLGKTKTDAQSDDASSLVQTFISPIHSLLDYPSRRDERLLVEIDVRIFLSATVVIAARVVDISKHGLRVQLIDETELTLIKGYRPVQVVFTGLGKESKIDKLPIEYRINSVSKGDFQADIHLQREWKEGPKPFNSFIESLFASNKKRESIDTRNTQMAIESKIYEQAFALNCPGLSLFINTQNLLEPFVDFGCFNDINIEAIDYWQDENNQQTLGFLLNTERLKKLLLNSDTERYMVIYCFNHVKDGKVYFYSATSEELEQHPELKEVFLGYASRKASWKVYKLDCHQIDTERARLPSSLPNGINAAINQANAGHAPKLAAALKPLSHMITLSDLTHTMAQENYKERAIVKGKVQLLSLFGHARNRPPYEVKMLKFAWFDKRKERRYKLRTDIEIIANNKTYKGVSEDISTRGLKLELDANVPAKVGDVVFVSFIALQKITDKYDLIELPYKIQRISDDAYILHLQLAESTDSGNKTQPDSHAKNSAGVQRFFKMLIDKNRDRLQVLPSDQVIPGLRQALRTMQARYTPQMCIFTHQVKDTHYPSKVAVNPSKALSFKYFSHNMPAGYVNLSCIFKTPEKQRQFLALCLNSARKHQNTQSQEVYIVYDVGEVDHDRAVKCMWEQELASPKEAYDFIKSANKQFEFFACKVSSTAVQKPVNNLYFDELNYLRKSEPDIAKAFDGLAWSFSGQVFLTDITSEVLWRYGLIKQSQNI